MAKLKARLTDAERRANAFALRDHILDRLITGLQQDGFVVAQVRPSSPVRGTVEFDVTVTETETQRVSVLPQGHYCRFPLPGEDDYSYTGKVRVVIHGRHDQLFWDRKGAFPHADEVLAAIEAAVVNKRAQRVRRLVETENHEKYRDVLARLHVDFSTLFANPHVGSGSDHRGITVTLSSLDEETARVVLAAIAGHLP